MDQAKNNMMKAAEKSAENTRATGKATTGLDGRGNAWQ